MVNNKTDNNGGKTVCSGKKISAEIDPKLYL